MTRITCALTIVVASLASGLATPGEKQSDQQAIQGTWKVVSAVYNGKPSKALENEWVLNGTHVSYSPEAKDEYHLRPDKNPKWIDVVVLQDGKEKGRVYGIYSLSGDSLKICVATSGQKRPTKFESPAGSGYNLFIMKRVSKKAKE